MCHHTWQYIFTPFLVFVTFLGMSPDTLQKEGFVLLHRVRTPSILVAKPQGKSSRQLVTYPGAESRGTDTVSAHVLLFIQSRVPDHGMRLPTVRGIFLP